MAAISEWSIRRVTITFTTLQLAVLGLVISSSIGIELPFLRPSICFIYLTFVPGILILTMLKIKNINLAGYLAYSVGISICVLMLTGLVINIILPVFGISRSITVTYLTITLLIVNSVLCMAISRRKRDIHSNKQHVEGNNIKLNRILTLFLILILAILGPAMINHYNNNSALLILITLISLYIIGLSFNKSNSFSSYSLALWFISLAIFYHRTLVSPALMGWDNHIEHYYQKLVTDMNVWDPAINGNINAMLSIVMLAPIYSIMLNIESTYVFKTIYPIIFSFMPVALFQAYKNMFGANYSFISTFFFMSMITYITSLTMQARQATAELYFSLLILLITSSMNRLEKSILTIIFTIGIVVSHYSTSYIVIGLLTISWLLLSLTAFSGSNKLSRILYNGTPGSINILSPSVTLNIILISFLIVVSLSWYMYTSSSTNFNSAVSIGRHIYDNMIDFFNLTSRGETVGMGVGLGYTSTTITGQIFRTLQYITQLFIIFGLLRLILKPSEFNLTREYKSLSLVSFFILLLFILAPFLTIAFSVERYYHIALLLLSPFCILGGEYVWNTGANLFNRYKRIVPGNNNFFTSHFQLFPGLISLFILIPYFLFNTGFIFEIGTYDRKGDFPSSFALSHKRLDTPDYFNDEASAAQWLKRNYAYHSKVVGDEFSCLTLFDFMNFQAYKFVIEETNTPGVISLRVANWYTNTTLNYSDFVGGKENIYVYLRERNVSEDKFQVILKKGSNHKLENTTIKNFNEYNDLISKSIRIYDNKSVEILNIGKSI